MPQHKMLVLGLIGFLLSFPSRSGTAQTYTDLHDFNCAVEGCNPGAPAFLAQGRDGNLYGTTFEGGVDNNCVNCGTVFKTTTSGSLAILYNFGGGTEATNLQAG